MGIKRFLCAIAVSIVSIILLMFLIYDFEMSWMNLSNAIFLVGVFFFFPGLISVTGAGQVFYGSGYLSRKIFTKRSENCFKTFNDYKEYRRFKHANTTVKGRGLGLLILGGMYVIVSLAIGFMN